MSLLSGVLVGGVPRSPLGHPPLDDSHNPFKRDDERPGGPAKRYDHEAKVWECNKVAPKKSGSTTQRCVYVGPPGLGVKPGKVKFVNRKKKYMKKYNKKYREHVKSLKKAGVVSPGGKFTNKFQPDYHCRPTNSARCKKYAVAAATAKKAVTKKKTAKKTTKKTTAKKAKS